MVVWSWGDAEFCAGVGCGEVGEEGGLQEGVEARG